MSGKFEFGISTFADVLPDPHTGKIISQAERIRQVVEEIALADKLGVDFFGVGEHHRPDFAASAPAIILAAAATRTKQIRLGTAVTVLSTDDPIRVFQDFATIHAISKGRVELIVGRGAFTESFPLFGHSLNQYDVLFKERLDLLLKARDNEVVNWSGETRSDINNLGVYPRTETPLKISMALGGSPQTVIHAANEGLPVVLAILGGNLANFIQYSQLYRNKALENGYNITKLKFGVQSHGFVLGNSTEAAETFFPYLKLYRNKLLGERGYPPYTQKEFEAARSPENGLFVGSSSEVANKILLLREYLGIDRFIIQFTGTMPPELVKRTIKVYATEVIPLVRQAIELEQQNH